MQIIQRIDDFLFTIFPALAKDHDLIIPGKQFSGYQILSYMYVSFALVIPEGVNELGLNYKNEYEMAKGMSGLNK